MANQISCYGVREAPGTAFDYNDWQMALFWDTLFLKVYGATWETVDEMVFYPLLAGPLGCQDNPTLMAFHMGDRPGRLAISPRDFCRFGLLYLSGGRWGQGRLLAEQMVSQSVTSPLDGNFPRAGLEAAEMISGQRTFGSKRIPDNQTDHFGSYSWLWWVNGLDRDGQRLWPGAPERTYAALGHGSKRGLVVLPELDIVFSWNETMVDTFPLHPHPLTPVLQKLMEAAGVVQQ